MKSKIYERAVARITPEERARMIKSLDILSQIHSILDRKDISQKALAQKLKVSEAAVSKMLSPGGNLGMVTLVRLEMLLGETIIITPQKAAELEHSKTQMWDLPEDHNEELIYANVDYQPAESRFLIKP